MSIAIHFRKNQINRRPKPAAVIYLLPLAAVIFLLYARLSRSSFDFHRYDTYYSIGSLTIAVPVAMYLFASAGLYLAGSGWLRNRGLTNIHVLLTVTGWLLFFMLPLRGQLVNMPNRYFRPWEYRFSLPVIELMSALLLVAAAVLSLLANFFWSIKTRRHLSPRQN